MPSRQTLYNWLTQYPEFLSKYTRALPLRRMTILNEALEIVDSIPASASSNAISRARVRADIRLRVSDRMEGKQPKAPLGTQTHEQPSGRPCSIEENYALQQVHRFLKKALKSGDTLEGVIY